MSLNPSDVTSRPVYEPLRADPSSARHWLVLDASGGTLSPQRTFKKGIG